MLSNVFLTSEEPILGRVVLRKGLFSGDPSIRRGFFTGGPISWRLCLFYERFFFQEGFFSGALSRRRVYFREDLFSAINLITTGAKGHIKLGFQSKSANTTIMISS